MRFKKIFLRLEDIAKILVGEWSCWVDHQQIEINDEERAKYRNYVVVSINAQNNHLNLEIKPWESPVTKVDPNEKWYHEYTKQFGTAPDFF